MSEAPKLSLVQSHLVRWLQMPYAPEFAPETWFFSLQAVRIIHRFAFLAYALGNDAPRVQWGALKFGEGPYGRTGISQTEALELIYFYGRRDALIDLAPVPERERLQQFVKNMLLQEQQRVAREVGFTGGDPDDADD